MNNDLPPDSALLNHERRLEITEKTEDHLDHLLHALDALIYLYFAALYVLDNLSLILLLRLANQIVHVRSPSVSQLPPTILVSIGCVLTHLLSYREKGKRLYGGILIDFVGELAPATTRLLMLDIIVFGLQLLMLVAGHERQLASGELQAQEGFQPQDLASEEAGQLRSRAEDATETEEGIEMQSLLPDESGDMASTARKRREQTQHDNDMILLDMRKGLKTLVRKPMPVAGPANAENPAVRASLATFLARLAAARGAGR